MANIYGDAFSSSTPNALANGNDFNAASRGFRTTINLATEGGGTTNTPAIKMPRGCVPIGCVIGATVDCSGINLSVGISGTAAKYSAAAAGPNAVTQRREFLPATLDDGGLSAETEIIVTPSGNWPASGLVTIIIFALKV